MTFYTYVLKSLKNGNIYVGSCEDIDKRLWCHNQEKVKSTKSYRPWKLLKTFEFITRSEAFKYEHFLKTGQQKELLRKEYSA